MKRTGGAIKQSQERRKRMDRERRALEHAKRLVERLEAGENGYFYWAELEPLVRQLRGSLERCGLFDRAGAPGEERK